MKEQLELILEAKCVRILEHLDSLTTDDDKNIFLFEVSASDLRKAKDVDDALKWLDNTTIWPEKKSASEVAKKAADSGSTAITIAAGAIIALGLFALYKYLTNIDRQIAKAKKTGNKTKLKALLKRKQIANKEYKKKLAKADAKEKAKFKKKISKLK